ncbi:MAG: glycosyltransferase [Candidatus Geothermincolia bacterium]
MTRRLKILVTSSIFPNCEEPVKGIYIYHQLRALARLADIRVVAPVPYFPRWVSSRRWQRFARIPPQETIGDIEVLHPRVVIAPGIGRSIYGFQYYLCLLPTMRQLVREFVPDALLCYWAYPDGFSAALLSRSLGLPLLIGGRGCDINTAAESPVRKRMVAWSLNVARRVLAVSEAMKRTIVDLGVPPFKVTVIPNGIDEEFLRAAERAHGATRRSRCTEGGGIIFCGRLSAEKGVLDLVRAAGILRQRGVHFRLRLIGDGPERGAVERSVRDEGILDRVTMLGERPHSEIPALIAAADVLCLPSLREGCPNVLIEALACGVPVVASAVGGVPELLGNPECGLMVPPGDPQRLAAALEAALTRDWDRAIIAGSVRDRSWDAVARSLLDEIGLVCS